MSRAFIREDDLVQDIFERPVSSHPNFVTKRGLAQIDAELETAQRVFGEAQLSEDRHGLARAGRDLRYWKSRRATAHVITPKAASNHVQFGCQVTIQRDDGRLQTYRIVGEDEADPSHGTISHVSPLARTLLGKKQGDVVRAGARSAEVTTIGIAPD